MVCVINMGAQLPKRHGRGGCHVERIHAVRHGDTDRAIATGDGLSAQALPLGPHKDCKAGHVLQNGVIKRNGIVRQRHGSARETGGMQGIQSIMGPRARL